MRQVLRLHHYSIHTERSYVDWVVRYVRFHRMQSRADLYPAEPKIEAFLTHLAVEGRVAPATQNQALNALVFLYKKVLEVPLAEAIDAVRAQRKVRVPVVLTREEVARVIALLEGTPQLVVKLLYGSGLRTMEAVRLRVKDVDFGSSGRFVFGVWRGPQAPRWLGACPTGPRKDLNPPPWRPRVRFFAVSPGGVKESGFA